MKDLDRTLHYGIKRFSTNEKSYEYITSIKEDGDCLVVESAFDEYFEKNKPYCISYETVSKKYDKSCNPSKDIKDNHTIEVGWCIYDHTNRKITNNTEIPEISFVFKKIK